MQLSASSSVEEVAAIVSDALTSAGITAVLSGGAAVQIYTSGLYESRDLDFVASASQRELEQVLDRLAAFYHWRDRQGLDQAVLVAAQQVVDLDEIERWSVREGHAEAHREFAGRVKKTRIGG